MTGPAWLADVLAAVALTVALFSAGRLIASRGRRPRRGEVDADGGHVLMGVAMAGMFVPRLATLPNAAWEAVFAIGAAWFGWRSVQVLRSGDLPASSGPAGRTCYLGFPGRCCEYPVPHLIDCVAMLYVFWAVRVIRSGAAPGSGMGGMAGVVSGVRLPAVGLVLALCICAYVVWLGDRIQLLAHGPVSFTRGHAVLAPRAATCCKIAMGVAMGVMLVDIL